jgi:hypothetical protein
VISAGEGIAIIFPVGLHNLAVGEHDSGEARDGRSTLGDFARDDGDLIARLTLRR